MLAITATLATTTAEYLPGARPHLPEAVREADDDREERPVPREERAEGGYMMCSRLRWALASHTRAL